MNPMKEILKSEEVAFSKKYCYKQNLAHVTFYSSHVGTNFQQGYRFSEDKKIVSEKPFDKQKKVVAKFF